MIFEADPEWQMSFEKFNALDESYYELLKKPGWTLDKLTPEEEARRCASIKKSWANDPERLEKARTRMIEMNKARTGPRGRYNKHKEK